MSVPMRNPSRALLSCRWLAMKYCGRRVGSVVIPSKPGTSTGPEGTCPRTKARLAHRQSRSQALLESIFGQLRVRRQVHPHRLQKSQNLFAICDLVRLGLRLSRLRALLSEHLLPIKAVFTVSQIVGLAKSAGVAGLFLAGRIEFPGDRQRLPEL